MRRLSLPAICDCREEICDLRLAICWSLLDLAFCRDFSSFSLELLDASRASIAWLIELIVFSKEFTLLSWEVLDFCNTHKSTSWISLSNWNRGLNCTCLTCLLQSWIWFSLKRYVLYYCYDIILLFHCRFNDLLISRNNVVGLPCLFFSLCFLFYFSFLFLNYVCL